MTSRQRKYDSATINDNIRVWSLWDAGFVELRSTNAGASHRSHRSNASTSNDVKWPKDHYTKTAPSGQPVLKTSTPNNLPRLQPFFGRERGTRDDSRGPRPGEPHLGGAY